MTGVIQWYGSDAGGGLIAASNGEQYIFYLKDVVSGTVPKIGRTARFQPVDSNPPRAVEGEIE
jgi:hypothetical protein